MDEANRAKLRDCIRVTRTHPQDGGAELWQRQRVMAGLSLRQAAKVLEVAPQVLSDVENGRRLPSQELLDLMARCYACGDATPTPPPG